MKLTDTQRRAIDQEGGNLQLIACVGSGKTEVVARRVASREPAVHFCRTYCEAISWAP